MKVDFFALSFSLRFYTLWAGQRPNPMLPASGRCTA